MLPDGTLTVLCEIGGFRRITNRSDYQKVRDNFAMDNLKSLAENLEAGFQVCVVVFGIKRPTCY